MAQPQIWSPYCGIAPTPLEWLARWNLDPVLIAVLTAGALAAGRLPAPERRYAWAAAAVLAVLFVSPLCALSSALFSARVTHHVLLVGLAAPLIARALQPWTARLPGGPLAWTGVHAAIFWLWHAPSPYAAALSSDSLYWLMQLSLLGSAAGFWMSVQRAAAPLAIGVLFVSMVLMGLLGALITFAGAPLFGPHLATTEPWGLTALEDQQLAGLIMWAPASGIYLAAALARMARLIGPDAEPARP